MDGVACMLRLPNLSPRGLPALTPEPPARPPASPLRQTKTGLPVTGETATLLSAIVLPLPSHSRSVPLRICNGQSIGQIKETCMSRSTYLPHGKVLFSGRQKMAWSGPAFSWIW